MADKYINVIIYLFLTVVVFCLFLLSPQSRGRCIMPNILIPAVSGPLYQFVQCICGINAVYEGLNYGVDL